MFQIEGQEILRTEYFDVDLCSLCSAYIPDCQTVSASVVPVAELDDGHRPSGGVLQVVLLT